MSQNSIQILPKHIANQIAAGEVVERPASVLKELLENALDARATRIKIELEQGGKRRIRVVDNGTGMSREDVTLCVERHATSKIRSEEDLYAIRTLGFRGEALPSIAAVSRLTITSRQRGNVEGWQVQVSFGRGKTVTAVGCPHGTSVSVEDLFLEIPARRRFLRQDRTELSHASQVVRLAAVSHPDVLFELYSMGRCLFRSKPSVSMPHALWPLVGQDVCERLVPVKALAPGLNLEGYISTPEDARTSSRAFYLFLNGRPIQSRLVFKAVSQALQGQYMKGQHPVGALFLQVDPPLVDVNVHPAKQEVRFHHEDQVFRMVYHAVKRAFESGEGLGKGLKEDTRLEETVVRGSQVQMDFSSFEARPSERTRVLPEVSESRGDYGPTFRDEKTDLSACLDGLKIIGQFARSYILVESPDGLLLVDQHAAHEALNFKRLMEAYQGGEAVQSQLLAVPMMVERTPEEVARLSRVRDTLQALGIQAEEFGPGEIIIKALPQGLAGDARAVEEILGELLDSPADQEQGAIVHELVATIACHSSVRANHPLTVPEMEALLRDLVKEGVTNCPHGRPVVINLDWSEIRRRFGR